MRQIVLFRELQLICPIELISAAVPLKLSPLLCYGTTYKNRTIFIDNENIVTLLITKIVDARSFLDVEFS